jgi:4-carboxymuconolactone decarboxylase
MTGPVSGSSPGLDAVARVAPAAASGYARIRGVIDADGALPATVKALLVATAATVRGYDAMARRELERGRALGLGDDDIGTAAVTMLLSRGEGLVDRFAAAAGPIAPEAAPRAPDTLDDVSYFLDYAGTAVLPERNAVLAQRAPDVFAGYHAVHHAALRADPAHAKLAELVCCVIQAAELQGPFVGVHADMARRVGATEDELLEAVVCAMPVAGVGAWAVSFEALGRP